MDIEPVSDGSFAVLIYLWWREWCLESYFQKGCFRALDHGHSGLRSLRSSHRFTADRKSVV